MKTDMFLYEKLVSAPALITRTPYEKRRNRLAEN